MAKRILYIVGEYPSVTETFVQREIEGLRERGMSIEVCPLAGLGTTELLSAALCAPWQLCGLMLRHSRELDVCSWRRRIGSAVKALAIARSYPRVEHLHAHFLGAPALTAYYLSRVLHIPYSLTAHAHDIYVETTPSVVLQKACFRTTCTEANVRYLADKEPSAPFVLVRHGINAQDYDGERTSRADKCRLLAVGRHVKKKGFRYLIEACAILQRSNFLFRCSFIGEGPELKICRQLAIDSEVSGSVEFLPFMPHLAVRSAYLTSDILVVPSINQDGGDCDGVPNVILEAMASRLPVIATDAGAICEVLTDRETGLVVPQRDPDALAGAIVRLWRDRSLREKLTAASYVGVRSRFDRDHWLDIIEDEFSRVFGETGSTKTVD